MDLIFWASRKKENSTYRHETCQLMGFLHVSKAEGVFGDGFRASSAMRLSWFRILCFSWLRINNSCTSTSAIICHFAEKTKNSPLHKPTEKQPKKRLHWQKIFTVLKPTNPMNNKSTRIRESIQINKQQSKQKKTLT